MVSGCVHAAWSVSSKEESVNREGAQRNRMQGMEPYGLWCMKRLSTYRKAVNVIAEIVLTDLQ